MSCKTFSVAKNSELTAHTLGNRGFVAETVILYVVRDSLNARADQEKTKGMFEKQVIAQGHQ